MKEAMEDHSNERTMDERNNVRIKGTKEAMDQGDERNNGTKEQWIKGTKEQWNERSNGGSK